MRIQKLIESIYSIPNSWVRIAEVRRIAGGLEVSFAIHKGKRGKKVESWNVTCSGVHEAKITDFDGGGIALYASIHPAARQHTAKRAELRWIINADEARIFSELYAAHIDGVDDWIDFDRYLPVRSPWTGKLDGHFFVQSPGRKIVCRGPEFLLRIYAKALKALGERTKLTLLPMRKTTTKPNVLHFGTSFIVADSFSALRTGA